MCAHCRHAPTRLTPARQPPVGYRGRALPGLPLTRVVEAGLGYAAGELAVLHGEVDHVVALVLGAVPGLLSGDAVARVSLTTK